MMAAAQGGEAVGSGLPRWTVLLVRGDVVQVTGPRVPGAEWEGTVLVAQDDQFPHPRGRVMGVDGVGTVQVEDGLDGDPGPADPVPDPGDGGRPEPLHRPKPGRFADAGRRRAGPSRSVNVRWR